ncbi:unnamed protein product, partial [Ceratitis capitata]
MHNTHTHIHIQRNFIPIGYLSALCGFLSLVSRVCWRVTNAPLRFNRRKFGVDTLNNFENVNILLTTNTAKSTATKSTTKQCQVGVPLWGYAYIHAHTNIST